MSEPRDTLPRSTQGTSTTSGDVNVSDFIQWMRSLPGTEKALLRKYLTNQKVEDAEENWNLRFDYVERYMKIPKADFIKICESLGVAHSEVSQPHVSPVTQVTPGPREGQIGHQ